MTGLAVVRPLAAPAGAARRMESAGWQGRDGGTWRLDKPIPEVAP